MLEHLEGETLADRLQRESRGLKLSDVLRIAIGIADALDAAHRHGFVHRDLKPGNVMLTAGGPKLLDFGLAKQSASGTAALSMLATQPGTATAQGTIVGTLQYMAPEQIQEHQVDARTDVFALGAVLFEMVTGRKAFEARTQASLIAKILEIDPPALSSLVPVSPPALERLVQRCLAKQPDDRWQSARDVLLELRWIQEDREKRGPAETRLGRWRQWLPWAVAATAAAAAAIITVSAPRPARPDRPPVGRFDVSLPQNVGPAAPTARARPLARWPAPRYRGEHQRPRPAAPARLDDTAFVPLSGTDDARRPFWSPDGRWIGFFAAGKLWKIAATGGSVVTICDPDDGASGGSWGRNGDILFAMSRVIYRVPDSGGTPVAVTTLDGARGDKQHSSPHFLPNGRAFLLEVFGPGTEIHVGSLDSATTKLVVPDATEGVFAGPASLLFIRAQSVVAVPFDAGRLEVTGSEQTIANHALWGLSASSGIVVFRRGSVTMTQLRWWARDGRRLGALGSSGPHRQLVLSPSGKRLALQKGEISPTGIETVHIWTMDVTTGIATRVNSDLEFEVDPAWSPDERSLAFTGRKRGVHTIIRKDLFTGGEQPLAEFPFFPPLDDWAPDGRLILRGGGAIQALAVSGEGIPQIIHGAAGASVDQSQVSPDSRWIAFNSNESGRWEVHVARFPDFSDKRPISDDGGVEPLWRSDGRELFTSVPADS